MHRALARRLPFLNWPRPSGALLRGEALAGLTVGLMVIPQGVAYAALAGMPVVTGIYASMLPALVAALFSASPRLSVGPTALSSLLVAASLTGLATPGSAEWVNLAVWLALLTGALQIALGAVQAGWLLNLVTAPVLMAFTQGAAVLIIFSQLPALLGLPKDGDWAARLTGAHWASAAFGIGALALLVVARRLKPSFPGVLVVVLVAAAVSAFTPYAAQGGAVVGPLPQGLPGLFVPHWPGWATLGQLVMPTLIITLVSFLETASSAKVDSAARGARWDQNQDLIGQGLAKLASGLSGAFPTSSSFSRSALNLYAGAKTGWASIFSAVVVGLALLVFTPVLRHVPKAVLAAIVVATVYGLLKPREFGRLWQVSRLEAVIAAVTFVVTLLAAPALYWGVLAGVLMSLSHFLYQHLHPRILEVGEHPDGSLRSRTLWRLPPIAPRVLALRMDAALDFATAAAFERAVQDALTLNPDTRHLALFMQPVNRIDATGVETFGKLAAHLMGQHIAFHLVGLKLPVEQPLARAGLLNARAGLRLHRTDAEALSALRSTGDESADLAAAMI
ncbi:MAG: SulP family inorganic anion transporter [Ottowia sp.]|nr:SulP family inorganic anion transporter [Ottowia sp.]